MSKKIIIIATAVVVAAAVAVGVLFGTGVIGKDSSQNKTDATQALQTENAVTEDSGNNREDGNDVAENKFTNLTYISANDHHALAVRNDRTVIAAGDELFGQCNVQGWRNIISVAAGEYHSVGLRADGTVVATEYTAKGEIAQYYPYSGQCDVKDWSDIVAICADGNFTIGLKADGTVVTAGEYAKTNFSEVEKWKNIVAITCADYHVVGLKNDGTVVATSPVSEDKNYGQTDVADWSDIVSISAGTYHTLGLKSDGTVVATKIASHASLNDVGQVDVDEWTDIVAVSAEIGHSIGLKKDGTVVFAGNAISIPKNNNWSDTLFVEAAPLVSIGVKSDGAIIAYGNDASEFLAEVSTWTNIMVNYKDTVAAPAPDADVTTPEQETPTQPVTPPENSGYATEEQLYQLGNIAFCSGAFDRNDSSTHKDIAASIIGFCGSYDIFYDTGKVEFSGVHDPLNLFYNPSSGPHPYYRYNGENVDKIIRNVYGVEPDHNYEVRIDWYNGIDVYSYYHDGYYYTAALASGIEEGIDGYEAKLNDDGTYTVKYDIGAGEDESLGHLDVEAKLIKVDGKPVWTLYKSKKVYDNPAWTQ